MCSDVTETERRFSECTFPDFFPSPITDWLSTGIAASPSINVNKWIDRCTVLWPLFGVLFIQTAHTELLFLLCEQVYGACVRVRQFQCECECVFEHREVFVHFVFICHLISGRLSTLKTLVQTIPSLFCRNRCVWVALTIPLSLYHFQHFILVAHRKFTDFTDRWCAARTNEEKLVFAMK